MSLLNHSPPIYLDYASSTPVATEVVLVMSNALSNNFGNASSPHSSGFKAEQAINIARQSVQKLLSAPSANNIIFTSGATEANNLALQGLTSSLLASGTNHIISSKIEHKAVLDTLRHMVSLGFQITLLTPNENGIISTAQVKEALTSKTGLISLMHVNNETGYINPILEIGSLAHDHSILFHVDAAQSAGKVEINVQSMNVDLLSISAHKFYGPKGVGALYTSLAANKKLAPIMFGGGQENGLRAGTYPTHQIIGFGKAAEMAFSSLSEDLVHSENLQKIIINQLSPIASYINSTENSLANIVNLSIFGIDSATLITSLQNEVAISSGSACNSGTIEPSHVLQAMGFNYDRIDSAIRISFGRYTTETDIRKAADKILNHAARIRSYTSVS